MLELALLIVSLAALAAGSPLLAQRQRSVNAFINQERRIALQGAINNIGGTDSPLVPGADPGIVVASPSTVSPDYFYTWTRDSALVLTMLVEEFVNGDKSIQYILEDCAVCRTPGRSCSC
jgi:glucoamylase